MPAKFIFISYVNRSGSTFLANLLSKSPEICVCPEAEILLDIFLVKPFEICSRKSVLKLKEALAGDSKLLHWKLPIQNLEDSINGRENILAFMDVLTAYKKEHKPVAKSIVFKAERFVFLRPILQGAIGKKYNLRWIALFRDCRGVYASQQRTVFPGTNEVMSYNPVRTALLWNNFVRRSLKLAQPKFFLLLHYENLILNTAHEIKFICAEFGLLPFDYEKGIGDLWMSLPEDQRAIHANIDTNPLFERVRIWETELSKPELLSIQYVSEKYLKALNYKTKVYRGLHLNIRIIVFYRVIQFYLRLVLKKILFKIKLCLRLLS